VRSWRHTYHRWWCDELLYQSCCVVLTVAFAQLLVALFAWLLEACEAYCICFVRLPVEMAPVGVGQDPVALHGIGKVGEMFVIGAIVLTSVSCIDSDACVYLPCFHGGLLVSTEIIGTGVGLSAFVGQCDCDLCSFALSQGLGLVRSVIVVYSARVSWYDVFVG